MQQTTAGNVILGPVLDIAMCMLLLGCVQSSTMTLLNHIGVSTMGSHAYTVRAAGSAGYMIALLLMGSLGSDAKSISDNHLFIGATISLCHAIFAFFAWYCLPASKQQLEFEPAESTILSTSNAQKKTSVKNDRLEWIGLLLLVWIVAICEMSYGLYAHEFLTTTYGNYGYFVFAGAIAIEIAVLGAMPFIPSFRRQLLIVGPICWILLFGGCLMATQGFGSLGLFALALALNCPFQISTNEHAHRMNPSVMGVASMTLAQSLGYTTATVIASIAARFGVGPAPLWIAVLPIAVLALLLAMLKLARQNAALDVYNLGEANGVAQSRGVVGSENRPNDLESRVRTNNTCSDAEDIHLAVLDTLASGIGDVAQTSADTGKIVRRHANANT